ncbi:zinc finger protein 346 isoform X2 [Kryptolebias marmoratus]|uniref:zinc finger protein 346 isoform X2 n=1 Tax=Kryptolebias marmoratus TaxID=37003 RepID=UPI0007F8CDD1|nr:zinc finger protein 346 isoform X2 [Kryptolebias marmoratus]
MRSSTPLVCVEIMAEAMQTDNFPYLPSGPAEVNKMIQEHGDLFSDTQCKVCSAALISESQKLTHYQSKKHANKVRRYFFLQNEKEETVKRLKTSDGDCDNGDADRMKACHLCNMTFTSPVMAESHYKGKFHAKRLKMKMVENKPPAEAFQTAKPKEKPAEISSGVTETDNNNNPDRFCSICKASFNNPLMAQQHYDGKKHRKRMTRLKLIETYGPSTAPVSTENGYPCTTCNIVLNSVEQYQSHISGARHKNQVKKSSLKPAEDQHPAEQSQGGDNQCTPAENQCAPAENQCAPADEQCTPAENQFAPGDDQFAQGDGQYAANDQYTHEYTEFSEQFQYA